MDGVLEKAMAIDHSIVGNATFAGEAEFLARTSCIRSQNYSTRELQVSSA